ncbi:uncharacterized protein FTOL_11949 [Fusarium torulosum]|uniref:Ubiquitin-like protease family profile domain-containing protein n=1 Tax=Fusarium torulosum TaxID=33205 RepID=A0AAE8MJP1_9HYPO|nr:uncharacterized protein FTOL_11949 [Fusarium torulosum]
MARTRGTMKPELGRESPSQRSTKRQKSEPASDTRQSPVTPRLQNGPTQDERRGWWPPKYTPKSPWSPHQMQYELDDHESSVESLSVDETASSPSETPCEGCESAPASTPIQIHSDDKFTQEPTDSISATISRLRERQHLTSIDNWRIAKTFPTQHDLHIFEPGFPYSPRSRQVSSREYIFLLHSQDHWSLARLGMTTKKLHHYNSLRGIHMDFDSLTDWVQTQLGISLFYGDSIIEEQCPQQDDSISCGLFILAFLQYLIEDQVPSEVNLEDLRETFATQLEQQHLPNSPRSVSPSSESSSETLTDLALFEPRSSMSRDTSPAIEALQNYSLPPFSRVESDGMTGYFETFRDSFQKTQETLKQQTEFLAMREEELSYPLGT